MFVIGMTFGRLFGAKFVQKGRKLCVITSAIIGLVAIGIQMVENVSCLIGGRFVYGIASGIFIAVGIRYVEECSPP